MLVISQDVLIKTDLFQCYLFPYLDLILVYYSPTNLLNNTLVEVEQYYTNPVI